MSRRVLVALPQGRGVPPIRRLERQQVGRVAHADPCRIIAAWRKLGIEVEIRAGHPVKEFEVAQQRNRRPDVLDEDHLAPAGMANHQVGSEPLALQSFVYEAANEFRHLDAGPLGQFRQLL